LYTKCRFRIATAHNFETDPIQAYVDSNWVTAKGTTLGADNGIGVAAILAVLEDKKIRHGPLEALLTINEECGMSGAMGLQPGWLDGEILMNLDSEDEGELYTGCAGGIDVTATFPITWVPTAENAHAFRLTVKGLKGGHSGVDIHRGRSNANKLLIRILLNIRRQLQFADSQDSCRTVRKAFRRNTPDQGDARRIGMRYSRREIPPLGHYFVRSHHSLSPLPG
jgi:dipeptidase D